MWDRHELKQYAKDRMNTNYWRMVLAAFIFMLVAGGTVNLSYRNNLKNLVKNNSSNAASVQSSIHSAQNDLQEAAKELNDISTHFSDDKDIERLAFPIAIIALIIALIIAAIAIAISVFLRNPLQVGGARFFMENHSTDATCDTYGIAFRTNYRNIVIGMFLRNLYTFAWSLLFIIPGIIKAYEYRMIPYILADNPDISYEEAFDLSKQMMDGNKWDTFVLDLSFIGWNLLSALTLGLVGIFYVNPFELQTNAELYLALRGNPVATEAPSYGDYIEMT